MGAHPAARIASGAVVGGVVAEMSGGDFAQGALQGAWTSAIALISEALVVAAHNQKKAWVIVNENKGGCYECIRLTESESMPGNHSSLWNDLDQVGDGMAGSLGSGDHYAYVSKRGPDYEACFFIEGSRGVEKQMMQYMHTIMDRGVWFPYINDCFLKVDNVINNFKLENPNAPGRFDELPPPGRYKHTQ